MKVRVQNLHKFNDLVIFLWFKKNFQIWFLVSAICNYINLYGDNAEVTYYLVHSIFLSQIRNECMVVKSSDTIASYHLRQDHLTVAGSLVTDMILNSK